MSCIVYGLFLGLGLGILFALILPGIVDKLTFGDALLICAPICALTGAVVGAIMTPQNLLSTLAARIPDNFVFPGFIFIGFLVGLLAILNPPNLIPLFPAMGDMPPASLSGIAMIVLGVVTLAMIYLSITSSGRTIDGIRLTERDGINLAQVGIKQFARILLVENKNGTSIAGLASKYQFSQQAVEDLIAWERRQFPGH